jgi:hypothetical protein
MSIIWIVIYKNENGRLNFSEKTIYKKVIINHKKGGGKMWSDKKVITWGETHSSIG